MREMVKWAGSEDSFHKLEAIMKQIAEATPEMRKQAMDWEDEQDELQTEHWMLDMQGKLAVITIDGPLVCGSTGWWGMYMGIVGYDDIRNAVICAMNAGAGHIMFHIKSPGGMVAGVGACTDFLKEVNAKLPITFYTDTYAASGGVWLSVSTGDFRASRHAEAGSVGVIAVMSEYTEYFKKMGINTEVFKTSALKAAGNPNEKLSEAAKKEIQRSVDESGQHFIDHIAESLGLSSDYVKENIATGQMWYAEEAKRRGLVTSITTFDQLMIDLQNKLSQNTDNNGLSGQTGNGFTLNAEDDMARRKLKNLSTEEALALAASGVEVKTAADDDNDGDSTNDDDNDGDGTTNKESDDGTQGLPLETENDDENDGVKEEKESSGSLTKLLADTNSKLIAASVDLAKVQGELTSANAKIDLMAANEAGLKQIVAIFVQRCTVMTGAPAPALDSLMAMDASALIAQHAAVESQLSKRFGNGGRVSVDEDDSDSEEAKKAEAAAKYANQIMQNMSRIGGGK